MADSRLRSLVGGVPLRDLAGSLLLGAFAGVAIVALCGGLEFEAYVVYGTHIAVLWALLRAWVGRPSGRPGLAVRVTLVVAAGVLLTLAVLLLWEATLGSGVVSLDSEGLEALMLVSLLAGTPTGVSALLLAIWAERSGLRAGRVWWLPRGLAAGMFSSALCSVGFLIAEEFGRFWFVRWSDPTSLLWYATEEPFVVLVLLAPPVVLAMLMGADSRWRCPGGMSPPAPGASPSPLRPLPADDPPLISRLDSNPWPA